MESRKVVESPVYEGPVKAKPDDFQDPPKTDDAQSVDQTVQAKPPVCSYSTPPGDGCESGERH